MNMVNFCKSEKKSQILKILDIFYFNRHQIDKILNTN